VSDDRSPILEIVDVSKTFPVAGQSLFRRRKTLHALTGVNLNVRAGQTLGIVGESGCGKSTLARIIVRLIRPDSGKVLFFGRDLASPDTELAQTTTHVQMVFQDPYASLNPRMHVGTAIEEPLKVHRIVSPGDVAHERDRLMQRVGLGPQLASRLPRELSGGERQRISIARALSVRPELLIADEAVSSLDVSVRAQILNLLSDLRSELGLTLIFISHDLSVVDHLSDRVAVMYLGRVVEVGPAGDVLRDGAHPYTRALVASVPQPMVGSRRVQPSLRGELPSPMNPPSGCVFRTRCPMAQAICSEISPAPATVGAEHWAACHFAIGDRPVAKGFKKETVIEERI
jgi:oligopeptide/dipeptide ABC transporter ATP-binding protein